jgi:hypothetical protein
MISAAHEETLAANSRENEGSCICDTCKADADTCGLDPNFCEKAAREQHGDDQCEARRDDHESR